MVQSEQGETPNHIGSRAIQGPSGRSRRIRKIHILLSLVIAGCAWLPVAAHAFYGSIVGRVSDKTGAGIRGASVTLASLGTTEKRTVTTDPTGNYRFVDLIPGSYRIEFENAGFRHFKQEPIDVRVDTATFHDISLALSDIHESVSVQEQAPLLETQGAFLGQVFEGRQVQDTPLNGRNVMNLVALVPGVIPQGGTQGSSAGNYAASGELP
jgi:Carboxypeptidase regulatory-like domain